MTDIPYPMIAQGDAATTVAQIISYLSTLVDSINRMFENIDITNLNANLADKIKSSVTEHQDLSAYATAARLKESADALSSSVSALKQYADETFAPLTALENYYTKKEIESDLIGNTNNAVGTRRTAVKYIEDRIGDIYIDIRDLQRQIDNLK